MSTHAPDGRTWLEWAAGFHEDESEVWFARQRLADERGDRHLAEQCAEHCATHEDCAAALREAHEI